MTIRTALTALLAVPVLAITACGNDTDTPDSTTEHGGTAETRRFPAPQAFWTSGVPRCGDNPSRIERRPLELWSLQQSYRKTLPLSLW